MDDVSQPITKVKILVVEDDNVVALHIRHFLEYWNYEVPTILASAGMVLEAMAEYQPDLVLMDIRLQGSMDGIEAAQQIRDRFSTPVVFITAHADEPTLQRALLSEPFGYILKPFQAKELQTTIEIALYRHRVEQSLRQTKQFFATALQSIGDATIVTDQHGAITFMNGVAESLTGWSQAEALGKKAEEIAPILRADTREVIEHPALASLRQGVTVGLPDACVLRTKDGREKPVGDSAAPIRNEAGEIVGSVLVFQDMTQRRQLHTTLQHQNTALRQNYTNMLIEVQEQGRQLQQTLSYAQLLKRLLHEVRGSLDEQHILSVAIAELGRTLQAQCCWLALSNPAMNEATVSYEHRLAEVPSALNQTVQLLNAQQGYYQLGKKAPNVAFSRVLPQPYQSLLSKSGQVLFWSLIDDQQVIGQLGVIIASNGLTPELLQLQGELGSQVAAYCAIAIRQARLYQSARSGARDFD